MTAIQYYAESPIETTTKHSMHLEESILFGNVECPNLKLKHKKQYYMFTQNKSKSFMDTSL